MYVFEDTRKFAERFEVVLVCWLEVDGEEGEQ